MGQDQRVKVLMGAGLSEPDARAGLAALDSGQESLQADRARRVLQAERTNEQESPTMADIDPLVEFLTARLDDDVTAVSFGPRLLATLAAGSPDTNMRDVAGREDEQLCARALREVKAKRAIMASVEGVYAADDAYYDEFLRALAAVYADHPDYRDEWRP